MARLKFSYTVAITGIVVGMHAILLPILYFSLSQVVRASHESLFLDHARTFTRMIADQLEAEGPDAANQHIGDLLDLAMLNGTGVYAEYIDEHRHVRSLLGPADFAMPLLQDFAYGEHGDRLYYMKVPLSVGGHAAELRMAFDESPTEERIKLASRRMLLTLCAYFGVSLLIAMIVGVRLSRPIRRLQIASKQIASGDYGERLLIESSITELHDMAVDMDHMRHTLVDVNEQIRAEIGEKERAEAQRRDLENELRHRQRIETVGTLAGGIAHEFNNALVPITLFTEAALADLHDVEPGRQDLGPIRQDLSRVLASARRAREVVRKILVFSHKYGDATLAVVDVQAVVEESLKLFSALVPSSVIIRTEIESPVWPVMADAALLQQLVMNLCLNGFQALRDKNGVLTIGLCNSDGAQAPAGTAPMTRLVELWVRDNGRGMDQATAGRIFEPFFTTRQVGQGTGLGLSVVHGIVESFGGRITVETAVDRGSQFTVFLPAAENAVAGVARSGVTEEPV